MKNEKLLQHQRHNIILERLENGETLSITELAGEWGILTKTLQRDFRKLMEGNYGIIRASDGKRFTLSQKQHTSKDANTAIKMLDSLSADIGGEFYTKAQATLNKLQQHIESPFYTRIDVENISSKLDLIEDLEEAISRQKNVDFSYKTLREPYKIKSYENVKPYKIIIFDGFWYLLAEYHGHYIKFYLKEIRNIKVLNQTFERNGELLERMSKALGFWFDPTAKSFEAILLLDQEVIVYFKRNPINGQRIKMNYDGTAELTVTATDKREIFDLLKKWLPQIRVIEPFELQEEFEEMLQGYLVKKI
ncbi:MAG: WYL domain-containing transcriptional regulator [Campylobacterota bacterium]|nr:WYL domain-containing transcriptional regulator [Campylobacterota bacterium]